MAQTTRTPDVEAQRTAMKKLGFLVGDWSGEASVLRSPGQFAELAQTESAQFRLDGLVLVIEGVGRTQADGKLSLQALGLISFDDETGTYRMRAFNDRRWLETVGARESGSLTLPAEFPTALAHRIAAHLDGRYELPAATATTQSKIGSIAHGKNGSGRGAGKTTLTTNQAWSDVWIVVHSSSGTWGK